MTKKLSGDAYQVSEVRNGPPSSYVSEKLCSSIKFQHMLIKDIENYIPDDFSSDKLLNAPEDFNVKSDVFLYNARYVFHYQINTFLALHNRLGLLENDLIEKLIQDSTENLESWMTRIEFVNEV